MFDFLGGTPSPSCPGHNMVQWLIVNTLNNSCSVCEVVTLPEKGTTFQTTIYLAPKVPVPKQFGALQDLKKLLQLGRIHQILPGDLELPSFHTHRLQRNACPKMGPQRRALVLKGVLTSFS